MPRHTSSPVAELEIDLWLKQAAAHRRAGEIGKAVALYQKVLSRRPAHPAALREMGLAAFDTGALDVAEGLMTRAVEAAPRAAAGHIALGRVRAALGRPDEAIASYRKALTLAPNTAEIFPLLGEAQLDAGDRDDARKSFRMALKLRPGNRLVAHMLAALEDGAAEPRNAYAADLFDYYAGIFDSHLVSRLGYTVPSLMLGVIDELAPGRRFKAALDLGCGTGLVAEAFRDIVEAIDGIDLAPKMVEAARAKNLYRELAVSDIAAWLDRPATTSAYDLVLAADVFIYVGPLEEVFAGTAAALRPGGLFAFSVETLTEGDVEIRSSGRFAHSTTYVARLAAEHGLVPRVERDIAVRTERNVPIPGHIVVLEKRGAA